MPKAKVKKVTVEKVEKKVEKVKKIKKDKVKRKPSAYAQFVKEHYKDKDVQAVPPKQRFGCDGQPTWNVNPLASHVML